MFVEEFMLIVFVAGVVLIAIPLAIGKRIFWLPPKNKLSAAAQARKKQMLERLEALKVEKEVARVEHEYQQEIDALYPDETKEKETNRGS